MRSAHMVNKTKDVPLWHPVIGMRKPLLKGLQLALDLPAVEGFKSFRTEQNKS